MKNRYLLLALSFIFLLPVFASGDLSNKQLENLIVSQAVKKIDKTSIVKTLGNPSGDNTIPSEKAVRKVVSKFLNMSSLPPSSVDSQVVLFKGSTGKMLKAAQGTGLAKLTSGVLGYGVAGTDYVIPSGNVATATALAANGSNCAAGQAAQGVSPAGTAEGCFTPTGTYVLPITDSVATTSSTTAASATAVKAAYDLANGKLSPSGSAANLTGFPILNQNTTGTAGGLTGTPDIIPHNVNATGLVSAAGTVSGASGSFSAGAGALSLTNATYSQILSSNTMYVDTAAGNINLRPGGSLAGAFSSTGLAVTGTISANNGANIVYYCNGGSNAGLLGRGNGGPCSGGSWVATSLKID